MHFGRLFLVVALLTNVAVAGESRRPQVVLLTSFAPQTELEWERDLIARQENKLARVFLKRWEGQGFQVHIAHHVDAEKLFQVIQGPGVKALFYVGHAGSDRTASAIMDYQNRNVRRLFERTHSDLEFLGLVGCNVERPSRDGAPNLEIYSALGLQEASEGLEKAILAAKASFIRRGAVLAQSPPQQCRIGFCVPVTIHRTLNVALLDQASAEFPPLQVSATNQPGVLGVMPAVSREFLRQEGEWTQHYTFWLPNPPNSVLSVLRVESGSSTQAEEAARAEIGKLKVETAGAPGQYRQLMHRNGKPVGVSSVLFTP